MALQNSENSFNAKREKFKHNNHYEHLSNYKYDVPSVSTLATDVKNVCIFCENDHDSKICKELLSFKNMIICASKDIVFSVSANFTGLVNVNLTQNIANSKDDNL